MLYSLFNDTDSIIENTDESITVQVLVPGHNKTNLEVLVENNFLKIKTKEKQKNIPSVNLQYKLNLDGIYSKDINAKCLDGVLTLKLPKRKNKSRFISIE